MFLSASWRTVMFLSAFSSTHRSNTTATTLPRMQQVILTIHRSNQTFGRRNRVTVSTSRPRYSQQQVESGDMTAFSTQYPPIFELSCHACGLQETRLTEAGRDWVREVMKETNGTSCLVSHWNLCALPGKRDEEASRLLLDLMCSTVDMNTRTKHCTRLDATSELSLHIALVIEFCMSSHCTGLLVLETMPRECEQMNSCCGDTFQFLSGLCAVPIMILAGLRVTPHLSCAVSGGGRSVCPGTLCDLFCARGICEQNRCSAYKSCCQAHAF